MDVTIVVAACGGVVLFWLWRRSRAAAGPETRLRQICLGDEGQVERLILAEARRAPGISRAEAAGRALVRYQRDNR